MFRLLLRDLANLNVMEQTYDFFFFFFFAFETMILSKCLYNHKRKFVLPCVSYVIL